jgi:hypothetical protein
MSDTDHVDNGSPAVDHAEGGRLSLCVGKLTLLGRSRTLLSNMMRIAGFQCSEALSIPPAIPPICSGATRFKINSLAKPAAKTNLSAMAYD